MASVYLSYALGSAAAALLTKSVYNYSTTPIQVTDEIESKVTVLEAKEAPKIVVEDEQDKEIKEEQPELNEIYVCSRCHMKKSLDEFSRNQQKRKPMNSWKCKDCTGNRK